MTVKQEHNCICIIYLVVIAFSEGLLKHNYGKKIVKSTLEKISVFSENSAEFTWPNGKSQINTEKMLEYLLKISVL